MITKRSRVNEIIIIFGIIASVTISGCSKENSPVEPIADFSVISGHIADTLTVVNSPYRVSRDLIVDSSNTLVIGPGVRIYFESSAKLSVHGKLECSGSATQPVLLSSTGNSWKGIEITNSPLLSILQFTVVENIDVTTLADTGRNGAVEISGANVNIQNSIFRNNRANNGGALSIDQSQSVVTSNIFVSNFAVGFGGAIVSSSSSNTIINNTFYQNEGFNSGGGLVVETPIMDQVRNNIFYLNTCRMGDTRIMYISADTTHYTQVYNYLALGSSTPGFVSGTNLHLGTGSPCIDAGDTTTQFNDVNGTRNDQGAYGGPLGNW